MLPSLKKKLFFISTVIGIIFAAVATTAQAEESANDKTLSPYFYVKSDLEGVEAFPLKRTETSVSIAGVIASVHVSQTYKNDGQTPIEALYLFPASTRAAVHAMRMQIGERLIEAEIKEKKIAKATYEKAKKEGKSASLLEQQRPNVFQMNVANIMPGDEVKVDMEYTEFLIPTEGIYEFVYPTVVGPRYSNKKEETAATSDKWVKNPYLTQGKLPESDFALSLEVRAPMPIRELSSPSHKIDTAFSGPMRALVTLDKEESHQANRDFVLHYRLAGDKIQTGTMLFQGEDENFFLTMVQPPRRTTPDYVLKREYIFVVDISGSMNGFPLDTAKTLLHDLISQLSTEESFNVVLFAGGASVLGETSLPATPENINKALSFIDSQPGGGGTELVQALKTSLALPRAADVSRTTLLITDGYVDAEAESFDMIRDNLQNTNVFAFGIGSSVNRYLIDGLARVGRGEPFVVLTPEDAPAVAAKFKTYVQAPLLRNVHLQFNNFDAYDIEPPMVPDLFASRPLVIFGKWRGEAGGSIGIRAMSTMGDYYEELPISEGDADAKLTALRYLWARERIARLADYAQTDLLAEVKPKIVELGLKYNLLTAYTSFVAVDKVVRNTGGLQTVKQPLPLPKGVSNLAVGGTLGTTPEPETYLLLILVGILLALSMRHRITNLGTR